MSLDEQIHKIADSLATEYSGTVPDPVVRNLVDQAYGEMSGARVTQFVPVLIARTVRERLRLSPAS